MNTKVKNSIALVTGANRGIGKAIVENLLTQGAEKVYLAVRNLQSTAPLEKKYGEKVKALQVDIADTESIKALAAQAQDVQIVVNNAGVLQAADPLSVDAEQALQHELNVNTFGLLRMAQAFTPILEKHSSAAFVQLNSVASLLNFKEFTTYSASKAASYSVTQGLRECLSDKGIQVLSVHPGPIATDMAKTAGMEENAEKPDVVAKSIVDALNNEQFLLFPDSMAQSIGTAYQSFSQQIIHPE